MRYKRLKNRNVFIIILCLSVLAVGIVSFYLTKNTVVYEISEKSKNTIADTSGIYEDIGKIHFSSSDFKFVYSAVSNSITPDFAVIYSDSISLDSKKVEFIERTIRSLSQDKKAGFKITGVINDGEYCIVSVVQSYNGIEFKDVYINFVFDESGLVHALGSWITSEFVPKYHEMLADGINAVYKLELDNISRIISERVLYTLKKGNENEQK